MYVSVELNLLLTIIFINKNHLYVHEMLVSPLIKYKVTHLT